MIKCLEVAAKIQRQLNKDCVQLLHENNLLRIFYPVYNSPIFGSQPIEVKNTIIVYIIYAYDNDSRWININADRLLDKENILRGLGGSPDVYLYNELIHNSHAELNDVIADYLVSITSWKWRTIHAFLDIHQQALKAITEPISSTDESEKEKIRKARTESLKQAMNNRMIVDTMLEEIKRDYVKTDRATQQDFDGLEITNEATLDPMSWKSFIQRKLIKS